MQGVFFVVKVCIQGVQIQPLYLPINTSAHQSQFVNLQGQKTSLKHLLAWHGKSFFQPSLTGSYPA